MSLSRRQRRSARELQDRREGKGRFVIDLVAIRQHLQVKTLMILDSGNLLKPSKRQPCLGSLIFDAGC